MKSEIDNSNAIDAETRQRMHFDARIITEWIGFDTRPYTSERGHLAIGLLHIPLSFAVAEFVWQVADLGGHAAIRVTRASRMKSMLIDVANAFGVEACGTARQIWERLKSWAHQRELDECPARVLCVAVEWLTSFTWLVLCDVSRCLGVVVYCVGREETFEPARTCERDRNCFWHSLANDEMRSQLTSYLLGFRTTMK